MGPGFTERDIRVAELRRQEFLVQAARNRSLTAAFAPQRWRSRTAPGGGRTTTFRIWVRSLMLTPSPSSGP